MSYSKRLLGMYDDLWTDEQSELGEAMRRLARGPEVAKPAPSDAADVAEESEPRDRDRHKPV